MSSAGVLTFGNRFECLARRPAKKGSESFTPSARVSRSSRVRSDDA